jgi:hypothetical protein
MVTLLLPGLVLETLCVDCFPMPTLPKLTDVGFNCKEPGSGSVFPPGLPSRPVQPFRKKSVAMRLMPRLSPCQTPGFLLRPITSPLILPVASVWFRYSYDYWRGEQIPNSRKTCPSRNLLAALKGTRRHVCAGSCLSEADRQTPPCRHNDSKINALHSEEVGWKRDRPQRNVLELASKAQRPERVVRVKSLMMCCSCYYSHCRRSLGIGARAFRQSHSLQEAHYGRCLAWKGGGTFNPGSRRTSERWKV